MYDQHSVIQHDLMKGTVNMLFVYKNVKHLQNNLFTFFQHQDRLVKAVQQHQQECNKLCQLVTVNGFQVS